MTQFLFIRHAESVANTDLVHIGGQSNHVPLTEKGEAQAAQLGTFLSQLTIKPAIAYYSGAVRTKQTADISLDVAGISVQLVPDERLLEISQGTFEGMDRRLAYTPENIKTYRINELEGKFPGGESMHDAQLRMHAFIEEVHHSYPESTVLVYGHGLAIRALVGLINGYSKPEILAQTTGNASITRIDVTKDGTTVEYVGALHASSL